MAGLFRLEGVRHPSNTSRFALRDGTGAPAKPALDAADLREVVVEDLGQAAEGRQGVHV
jgi:hypothetical protein